MVDVTEISNQALSLHLADHRICMNCGYVQRDAPDGEPLCRRCTISRKEASYNSYYRIPVHNLINAMQRFYHLEIQGDQWSVIYTDAHKRYTPMVIVVLFCTLGEVLLRHLLVHLMDHQGIDEKVQEKLLKDNRAPDRRIRELFTTLTGEKWKHALKEITREHGCDYVGIFEFYRRVARIRHQVVHLGYDHVISEEMPTECLRHIGRLVSLFVMIHNRYIDFRGDRKRMEE
jgi:hypothetical protein